MATNPETQINALFDSLQASMTNFLNEPRFTRMDEQVFYHTFLKAIAGVEPFTEEHRQGWDILAGDCFHGLSIYRGETFLYNTPALASSGPLKNLSNTRLVDSQTKRDWGTLSDATVTAKRLRNNNPGQGQAIQQAIQQALVDSIDQRNIYTEGQIDEWNKIFARYNLLPSQLAPMQPVQDEKPALNDDYDIV